MRTPEEAARRWQAGVTALTSLGYTGQTAQALLVLARERKTKCDNCGAPYRPDPRFLGQCAYCGARAWRHATG